jgi:hypothetical protein
MKRLIVLAAIALSCAPCLAQTGPTAGKGAEASRQPAPETKPCTDRQIQAFFDSVTSRLKPEAAAKFRELSRSDAVHRRALPSGSGREAIGRARQAVRSDLTALGSLPEGDIEALAFLVMMKAAKSAREDLKAIMKGVKEINKEKEGLRETQAELKKEVCEYIDEREKRTPGGKRH